MSNRTVLISGASIAGPALAFWLSRCGYAVTVVERAPDLRLGGQAVDFKGEVHRKCWRGWESSTTYSVGRPGKPTS